MSNLTQPQAAALDELQAFAAERKLSWNQIARSSGVGHAILSRLLSGNYNGNVQKYIDKLSRWLDEARTLPPAPDREFVDTYISRKIAATVRLAVDRGAMALIRTPSGCGKTASIRKLHRERYPERSIYLQVGAVHTNKTALQKEIARQMGLSDAGNFSDVFQRVKRVMAQSYIPGVARGWVLFADEAFGLSPKAINLLRHYSDDEQMRVVVVLIDTYERSELFLHSRHQFAITGGNVQLASRCRAVCQIDGLGSLDKRTLQKTCAPSPRPPPAMRALMPL